MAESREAFEAANYHPGSGCGQDERFCTSSDDWLRSLQARRTLGKLHFASTGQERRRRTGMAIGLRADPSWLVLPGKDPQIVSCHFFWLVDS